MIQRTAVRLVGMSHLIMHRVDRFIDLLREDPERDLYKELSAKRKKTDSDYRQLAELEWRMSLYVDEDGDVCVPVENLRQCVIEGARKSRLGVQFTAGIVIDEHAKLEYDGPKSIDKLWEDKRFHYYIPVKVGTGRSRASVMRMRPVFPRWSATVEIQFNDSLLNPKQLVGALEDAGQMVGLMDRRPQYGRFRVEEAG